MHHVLPRFRPDTSSSLAGTHRARSTENGAGRQGDNVGSIGFGCDCPAQVARASLESPTLRDGDGTAGGRGPSGASGARLLPRLWLPRSSGGSGAAVGFGGCAQIGKSSPRLSSTSPNQEVGA